MEVRRLNILSVHDSTQELICSKLAYTEFMLNMTLKRIGVKNPLAEITALEDLGLANNITRMSGGFYTGINVRWNSDIPFIPVDTTVNSCGVSIFKFASKMEYSDFKERLLQIEELLKLNGIVNNFNRGNHFISLCEDLEENQYLVLHASDNKYKFGKKGLYPREDTWYYNEIKVEYFPNGYIRYLAGEAAERFYTIYLEAEKSNPYRNRIVANLLLEGFSDVEELTYAPHYGMPNMQSVCIGSQWLTGKTRLILTREGAPIYLITEEKPFCQFMPHGFGLTINGECHKLTFLENDVVINDIRFSCKNGFITSGVAITRNSGAIINSEVIKHFMPRRNILVQKELIQKYSYTRNGIQSFKT